MVKWSSAHQLKGFDLAVVLGNHSEVLKNKLGCITDVEIKSQTNDSAKPRFIKARYVAYGILERVDSSDGVCQIVLIVNTSGKIRCVVIIEQQSMPLRQSNILFIQ